MVEKDEKGYFVDVSKQKPGKYKVVFEGDCQYQGKTYQFPIDRLVNITYPTGSKEIAKAQTLVYPNPAGIQLFIEASEPLKTIELRTLSGQVVSQQTSNQQTSISVSLAGLNNGVYLLRIGYQNGKTSLYKIVKTGSP
ncbi:MAG: T9SS type A sorting domain-containing protein [Prolixibacteraceae bacterium]|nr:T9SS type A sorting domain-containing protein [Prolixibacteraceae bacterium]